jgi:hypothetical protein
MPAGLKESMPATEVIKGDPGLNIWQNMELKWEFTKRPEVTDFDEYPGARGAAFGGLESRVYQKTGPATCSASIGTRSTHGSQNEPMSSSVCPPLNCCGDVPPSHDSREASIACESSDGRGSTYAERRPTLLCHHFSTRRFTSLSMPL